MNFEEKKIMDGWKSFLAEGMDGDCGCGDCEGCSKGDVESVRDFDRHDAEGRMARNELHRTAMKASKLKTMLQDADDLPEWVEKKISLAANYIDSVTNYMTTEILRHRGILETSENLSEGLQWHLENEVPLSSPVYREGSKKYYALMREARSYFRDTGGLLTETEKFYLEELEVGEYGVYEGKMVPLDSPVLEEDELEEAFYKGKDVNLNKPKRGSAGRAYVFVNSGKKDSKGRIKAQKVSFGSSMPDAMGDSEAARKRRKNFGDRHNCAQKNDKTKAGYWSCRATKFFGRDISGWW